MSLQDEKSSVRRAALAVRRAAGTAGSSRAVELLSSALAPYRNAVLAGYMPMRSELDPRPVMAAHKGRVAVPVVLDNGLPLAFRAWSPTTPMQPGAFGALIPETGDWLCPRVLIVPLLAFDRRGFRLGYGGGFYDRTLEHLRMTGPITAIGFAYSAQELPAVPTEPIDQPLDLIVTETSIILPNS